MPTVRAITMDCVFGYINEVYICGPSLVSIRGFGVSRLYCRGVNMFEDPSVYGGSGVSPDCNILYYQGVNMWVDPSVYGGSGVSPDYITEVYICGLSPCVYGGSGVSPDYIDKIYHVPAAGDKLLNTTATCLYLGKQKTNSMMQSTMKIILFTYYCL